MIKLYLDEDVHKKIAFSLRLKGYDVVSAHEVQNQSLPDYQQLQYAISEQRAIFTFNVADFDRLHREYTQKGKEHFGIILSKQISFSKTLQRLTQFLSTDFSKDIRNNLFWL
jgi:uncharacterized protein with PIN domain